MHKFAFLVVHPGAKLAFMNSIIRSNDGLSLSLDTSIYSLDAIKKAAYKFADRTSILINPSPGTAVVVVFNFGSEHPMSDQGQVIGAYCNELLDQDLRERIKRETTPVRNLILAHAFSRTSLSENT
jgi:His-Xaa-Ser system protein HxsD